MQDKKQRIRELRKIVDAPRFVCDCDDVLPAAWREPPVFDGLKCSKTVQQLLQEQYEREHPAAPKH